jgi:hypothetical protein
MMGQASRESVVFPVTKGPDVSGPFTGMAGILGPCPLHDVVYGRR